MRRTIALATVVWLAAVILTAQSISVHWSASAPEGVSTLDGHFDGRAISLRFRWQGPNAQDWTTRANIADVDLGRAKTGAASGTYFVEFPCKPHVPNCWKRTGFTHVGSVTDERDGSSNGPSCHQAAECQAFLDRIRVAVNGTRGTPAASPKPVDCEALRAMYLTGGRLEMPAECTSELGRTTTYTPGKIPGPAPRPPEKAPETVIDGSKIPSRIDFPGAKPVVPAPPPPPERPLAPVVMMPPTTVRPPEPPAITPPPVVHPVEPPASAPEPIPGVASPFDGLFPFPRAAATLKAWVTDRFKELSAAAFNDLRTGGNMNPVKWAKALVRKHVTDAAQNFLRDVASRHELGTEYDALPEAFRRDNETIAAVAERTYTPQDKKSGYNMVDTMGPMLDLSRER